MPLPFPPLQIQQVADEATNTTNNFKFKERINRFRNVNTRKFELTFGEENPAGDSSQKFWWSWARDAFLWSEGLDYTLKIVTVLNSATLPKSHWRFYCETKREGFVSHYYWPKTDPRAQQQVRRRGGGKEGGRKGGRGEGGQCETKESGLASYYF